jgi:hypothetical protein
VAVRTREIYRSPNRDRWLLAHDPETGRVSGMSLISPQVERSRARRTQVAVGRRGAVAVKSTTVVRPVRPWLQQPYYGAVFDGVTLGAVIAANAVPTSPSIDLCWYWSNSSKTRGYWDFCQ